MLINSEWQRFGGNVRKTTLLAKRDPETDKRVVTADLPPYSGIIFEKK